MGNKHGNMTARRTKARMDERDTELLSPTSMLRDSSTCDSDDDSLLGISDMTVNHVTGVDNAVSAYKVQEPYESVDYIRLHNQSYMNKFTHGSRDVATEMHKFTWRHATWRWVFCFLIGVTTAVAAFLIDFIVEIMTKFKYDRVRKYIVCTDDCESPVIGIAIMSGVNCGLVMVAAILCAYFAQCAAGSGIPEIKCFLNGIRYPGWLDLKTMMVKMFGVLFSVGATMPVGKEGPMIHSGAIIGAGLPNWLSTSKFEELQYYFRNDRAKRDFVSAGAAAGVAAAFGAPIGGVLFSLEEGCSFWSQSLTWRVFFTSMSCMLVLNFLVSGIIKNKEPGGGWGQLASGGMCSFGAFYHHEDNLWDIVDLVFFILIGAGGGVLGGVWNNLQTRITKYRMRRGKLARPFMVLEAMAVALLNSGIMMSLVQIGRCSEYNVTRANEENLKDVLNLETFHCKEGEFDVMASLAYNPLEYAIRNLFHVEEQFDILSCFLFFIALYFTSCWTYGLMIPSGLFVPSLACGAAYGRFVVEVIVQLTPYHVANKGVYALIGSAAFLGGVVRMTISLTVILIEATDQVMFSFPLMATLITAKWVGDHFNKGIYDIHIHLKKVPLLEYEAEPDMKLFLCEDVMSKKIRCFNRVNKLSDVIHLLESCTHNGFPIVEELASTDPNKPPKKRFLGLILRHQIITLLDSSIWGQKIRDGDSEGTTQPLLAHQAFNRAYPQRKTLSDLSLPITTIRQSLWIDFGFYMNLTPYTVQPRAQLGRAYVMFRGLGLRHLVVVDDENCVVGVITRKELTEHRVHELAHALRHDDRTNDSRLDSLNESMDVPFFGGNDI
eukprot:m.181449 g.181449  ORF g.181449 m.181449 type:complete len:832 (+) comp32066_c0_seq2:159-2654(+)